MMKSVAAIAILGTLCLPAMAQTYPGKVPSGSLMGNPSTSSAAERAFGVLSYTNEIAAPGVKCDGTTDDTAAINAALVTYAGKRVALIGASCKISDTIHIPQSTCLIGKGQAVNWNDIGVTSSPVYSVRLLWAGNAVGPIIAPTAVPNLDTCLESLTIDGQIATGSLAASTLVAIQYGAGHGNRIAGVTCKNLGYCLNFAPSTSDTFSWNTFRDVRAVNIRNCATFNPSGTSGGVTDNFFYNPFCYGYAQIGINFISLSDDNHFFGAYLSSSTSNTTGIAYNTLGPGVDEGVYSNDFTDLVMDIFNNDNTLNSIIVNNTGGKYVHINGFIGQAGAHPNLPVIQNGGLADIQSNNANTKLKLVDDNTSTVPSVTAYGSPTDIDLVLTPKGAGTVKFTGSSTAANGAIATALSSVGPTGSHTTVQEWLVIKNPSGTTRYIPLF